MDPEQARAFLDAVGLAELNLESLLHRARYPTYVNDLRYNPPLH